MYICIHTDKHPYSVAVYSTYMYCRLSREDIGVTYRCRANNNNITAPLESSIKLDIMCKYKIDFNNKFLYCDNQKVLEFKDDF